MFNALAFRAAFPGVVSSSQVYFDNAATTQKPICMMQELQSYYSSLIGSAGRGQHRAAINSTRIYQEARSKIASYIHARGPENIVFTRNATDAINIVAGGAREKLRTVDNIVVTGLEHNANLFPWLQACQRTGAKLRIIPLDKDGAPDITQALQMIDEHTRFVALSAASNVTGRTLPFEDLINIAHKHSALVLLDASQLMAHRAIDVEKCKCDFTLFSAHKLYGPEGLGVLYGRDAAFQAISHVRFGGGMAAERSEAEGWFEALPHPEGFEAGTQDIAAAVGFASVLDFLGESDERTRFDYTLTLLESLETGLSEIPGVHILPAGNNRIPILSFFASEVASSDLEAYLSMRGFCTRSGTLCAFSAVRRLAPQGTLRVSLAPYNTSEEVHAFLETIRGAIRYFGGKKR